jgi:hypothetical protein
VFNAANSIYWHLRQIVLVDIPRLWSRLLADVKSLLRDLAWLYHTTIRLLDELRHLVWSWIVDVRNWAWSHIWVPLKSYADQIWRDLLKWGYTAWWYITHPAALAELLGDPLVLWLEVNAWRIGRQLGTFALALVVHNLRRFAQLAEDVIAAVL